MCQSCAEIDKRIDRLREQLRSTADTTESECLTRLIIELYGDRVRLHRSEKP
jgi:hypothetical protein